MAAGTEKQAAQSMELPAGPEPKGPWGPEQPALTPSWEQRGAQAWTQPLQLQRHLHTARP